MTQGTITGYDTFPDRLKGKVDTVLSDYAGHPPILAEFKQYCDLAPPQQRLADLCNAITAHDCENPLAEIGAFYDELIRERDAADPVGETPATPPLRQLIERLAGMSFDTWMAIPVFVMFSAFAIAIAVMVFDFVMRRGAPDAPPLAPYTSSQGRERIIGTVKPDVPATAPYPIGTLTYLEGTDPPAYLIESDESEAVHNVHLVCQATGQPAADAEASLTCRARRIVAENPTAGLVFDLRRGKRIAAPRDLPAWLSIDTPPPPATTGTYAGTYSGYPVRSIAVGTVTHIPGTDPPRYRITAADARNVVLACVAAGEPAADALATLDCRANKLDPALPPGLVFDLRRGVLVEPSRSIPSTRDDPPRTFPDPR